ncbi:MAG: ATP synthase F0 subunit C [Gemmatimonadaceae bacterium]
MAPHPPQFEEIRSNLKMSFYPLLQAAVYNAEYSAAWAQMGAGIGAGIAVLGAGVGIGRLAGQAMDGMARQPEMAGRIQTGAIIFAALIEGAALFAIVVSFLIQNKF